ncbi:MAG: aminotransferase class I/II-fold pyridoxal phosphate-dependent enzyme, partial [Alphaproteobacteria bacterium]|nr:aminotransferase class I/II-fold pyridoxal phosphate-dependent enzyme [Alphaproteobacteria bacterium]
MEVVRAAAERAAAGGDVLHLEIGQPSTAAPRAVIAAAQAALGREVLGYTEALGVPALRARIARFYQERYGLALPAERIAVTVGSSGAFLLAFLAAFDAGDRVAVTAPGYPAYRHILRALDIEPVELPVGPASGFQPTVELLERAGRLDGLVVASPANPTGTMLSRAQYQALAAWCAARSVRLISDEIYHGICYGAAATSALAVTRDAVVVNSFSKYFSMTGWRLGWMVLPEDLVRSVECLAQNLFISAPSLAQHAALAAFDSIPELEANVQRYAANRALLLAALPDAGLRDFAPADGAFYLYADVGHLTNDSEAFCRRLLADTGVALTPGIDFDPARGSRFSSYIGMLAIHCAY